MSAPLLEVANLNKHFGGLHAVKDVSFQIERGEFVGILGPNGAGKTTLYNLLTGFIAPDAGASIVFEGRSILGGGAVQGGGARHLTHVPALPAVRRHERVG